MENRNAAQIIDRYNSGKATPEEIRLVQSWYLKMEAGEPLSPRAIQEEYDLGFKKLDAYLGRRKNTVLIWSAAAAVVLVALFTVLFFSVSSPKGIKEQISLAQDIPPGKNSAVITLSNGDTIHLSDAQKGLTVSRSALSYEDGTMVKKTAPATAAFLTARTPRGGTYNVTLADGTVVMLNADSYLKFPQVFNGKIREVELFGEAYFEVAKNKAMPFIVKTPKQRIEVLGTHFNVNSYTPAATKTTLLEGSVKVSSDTEEQMLVPGQQADLAGDRLVVKKADVDAVISWKDGYFRFNDENIKEIMQKISRWYDVEVVYEGDITNEVFTGAISRLSNISDVLDMLERTKIVHFKLEGRRITVLN
jgi:transmembrane sensor